MEKEKNCIVCNKAVNWDEVVVEFEGIINRVDTSGEWSLKDKEQAVYGGKVCSRKCYNLM